MKQTTHEWSSSEETEDDLDETDDLDEGGCGGGGSDLIVCLHGGGASGLTHTGTL